MTERIFFGMSGRALRDALDDEYEQTVQEACVALGLNWSEWIDKEPHFAHAFYEANP